MCEVLVGEDFLLCVQFSEWVVHSLKFEGLVVESVDGVVHEGYEPASACEYYRERYEQGHRLAHDCLSLRFDIASIAMPVSMMMPTTPHAPASMRLMLKSN